MPADIPDEVPRLFASGTTVKFHRTFDDYLASDGWTYVFYMNGGDLTTTPPQLTKLTVPATINPDGQSFDIVIPANVSAITVPTFSALPKGFYTCAERVTNATLDPPEVDDPRDDEIQVEVEKSVAASAAGDYISQLEKELAAVNAVILERISADLQSYQVTSGSGGGRAVVKTPIEQLKKLQGNLRNRLWRAKHPGQLGAQVLIAFTNEPEEPTFPPTWVDVTGLDR
jgi:hypothetical protein